jgi:hypothetical protein
MEQYAYKNVNNCLNTKIYSFLEGVGKTVYLLSALLPTYPDLT